jgi:hypothetical protein
VSWRKELRAIQQERSDLIRRDALLRMDLKWKVANALMYVQIADRVFSLIGRLIGGRRARRSPGRSKCEKHFHSQMCASARNTWLSLHTFITVSIER